MMLNRRHLVLAAASMPLALPRAWAHHGWSSFDQDRPIYLEGKVVSSKWQNPHAELMVELPPDLKLPADLAQRTVPAQSASVDGPGLLAKATLPKRSRSALGARTRAAHAHGGLEGGRDQARRARCPRWASPSRTRRAKP